MITTLTFVLALVGQTQSTKGAARKPAGIAAQRLRPLRTLAGELRDDDGFRGLGWQIPRLNRSTSTYPLFQPGE